MTTKTTDLRFTLDDAQVAADEFSFNCGPGALCALLGMTPTEIRPHLLDFEAKGYTNPTLMANILRGLGVKFYPFYQCSGNPSSIDNSGRWYGLNPIYPVRGLVRIQWAGPWTKPGVPLRARYRHTHWVAVQPEDRRVFDVNAMCEGGWLTWKEWANELVPWLIRESVPKANGQWWPTHGWEVGEA